MVAGHVEAATTIQPSLFLPGIDCHSFCCTHARKTPVTSHIITKACYLVSSSSLSSFCPTPPLKILVTKTSSRHRHHLHHLHHHHWSPSCQPLPFLPWPSLRLPALQRAANYRKLETSDLDLGIVLQVWSCFLLERRGPAGRQHWASIKLIPQPRTCLGGDAARSVAIATVTPLFPTCNDPALG